MFIDTRMYLYVSFGGVDLFVSIRICFAKHRYSYVFVSILRRWTPEKYKEHEAYLFLKTCILRPSKPRCFLKDTWT